MKTKDTLLSSIFAGFFIGVAGILNLLSENKYIGSFLFAFGLVNIIAFKLSLLTGVFAKISVIEKKVATSIVVLTGNFIGTWLAAIYFKNTYMFEKITGKLNTVYNFKFLQEDVISTIILSVLCGIFIGIAVWLQKTNTSDIIKLYSTILSVMFFILIGAEHCVANMVIFNLVGDYFNLQAYLFLFINIIGNLVGGYIVSLCGDYIIKTFHS